MLAILQHTVKAEGFYNDDLLLNVLMFYTAQFGTFLLYMGKLYYHAVYLGVFLQQILEVAETVQYRYNTRKIPKMYVFVTNVFAFFYIKNNFIPGVLF